MSPAARKYEGALNLPTIVSSFLDANELGTPFSFTAKLTIAHNAKTSPGLMKDWMMFTNVLGNGIFDNI